MISEITIIAVGDTLFGFDKEDSKYNRHYCAIKSVDLTHVERITQFTRSKVLLTEKRYRKRSKNTFAIPVKKI
jgi:hypothetical protein